MSLILAAGLGVMIWALAFVSPRWFVGLLILLYSPFKRYMTDLPVFYLGPPVYLSDIAVAAAGAYLLLRYLRGMNDWRLPVGVRWALLAFIVYGAISVLRGLYHFGPGGIGEARKTLIFVVFSFYLGAAFRNTQDFDGLLRTVYRLAVVVGLVSMAAIFFGFVFGGGHTRIIPATGGLLIGLGILVGITLRASRPKMSDAVKPAVLVVALLLASLVLNAHRSAWVGTSLGFVAFVAMRYRARSVGGFLKANVALGAVLLVLLGTFRLTFDLLLPDQLAEFRGRWFAFAEQGLEADYGAYWRFVAWSQELERIRQRPFFGSGFGNRLELNIGDEWRTLPTHSGHLEIISRQGAVGYMLFWTVIAALLVSLPSRSQRSDPQLRDGRKMAVVTLLVANLGYSLFYSFEFFFWLSVGLGLLYLRCSAVEERSIESNAMPRLMLPERAGTETL